MGLLGFNPPERARVTCRSLQPNIFPHAHGYTGPARDKLELFMEKFASGSIGQYIVLTIQYYHEVELHE